MIFTEKPTADLRFINRNGKRIMQQIWLIESPTGKMPPRTEWRDIPYIPNAEHGDETVHP